MKPETEGERRAAAIGCFFSIVATAAVVIYGAVQLLRWVAR